MKFNSKYFDCVRVKPDREKVVREEAPLCQWKGCSAAGLYRAPMGRGHEGKYCCSAWTTCVNSTPPTTTSTA